MARNEGLPAQQHVRAAADCTPRRDQLTATTAIRQRCAASTTRAQLPGSCPRVTVTDLVLPCGSMTVTGTACPGLSPASTSDSSALDWTGVLFTAVMTSPGLIPAAAAGPPGTTLPTATPAG